MTRSQLIDILAEKTGKTKCEVETWVHLITEEIVLQLEQGHNVKFSRFGTFRTLQRKARRIMCPNTGVPMQLPRTHTVSFRPSGTIRKRMQTAFAEDQS